MSKTKTKSENKTEKALAAEKEQFGKQQVSDLCFIKAEMNWGYRVYSDLLSFAKCVNAFFCD